MKEIGIDGDVFAEDFVVCFLSLEPITIITCATFEGREKITGTTFFNEL